MDVSYVLGYLRDNIEGYMGHNNDINFGHLYPVSSSPDITMVYLYGYPRVSANFFNMVTAFPVMVWVLVALVTLCSSLLLILVIMLYSSFPNCNELVKPNLTKADVVIKVISTLTEPNPMSFFLRWSRGKKLMLLMPFLFLFKLSLSLSHN